MSPPRRSLPVRSRAPGNPARNPDAAGGGEGHRPPAAMSEGHDHDHGHRLPHRTTETMGASSQDGGSERSTGGVAATGEMRGEERNNDAEEKRGVLVAALNNGKQITVKVKVGNKEFKLSVPKEPRTPQEPASPLESGSPPKSEPPPAPPQDSQPWICHTCHKSNLPTKKRCGSCQSWKGGTRKNIGGKKSKAALKEAALHKGKEPSKERLPPRERASLKERVSSKEKASQKETLEEEAPLTEEVHVKEKAHMRDAAPLTKSEQDDEEEEEEEADISMGARLPKRKRTNLYSSLSPAVIQATAKARAEAYAAAPPSPQLGSRSSRRKQSFDKKENFVHPAAIEAETVAEETGAVPDEFIGQDGNLFYCRICLGVGEVVCCDGCPHVFHPACLPVGPSKSSLENDDDPWYCHECVANGKLGKSVSPTKKRRKIKERCSECRRKETKAHPCVPCSGRNCDQFFHLVCPTRGEEDDVVVESPTSQRLLCTSCKAALVDTDQNEHYFEYDQRKLDAIHGAQRRLSSPGGRGRGGRGRGRGGRGGRGMRRMSSTEERMKRFKESEEQILAMRGKKREYSSGFQSPHIENDENDDDIGPESLALVEEPLSSTPAFFFFLLHNRAAIEKSLFRKSPFFRGLSRGIARNEKVAQEGAAIWVGMTPKERNEWVEVSMKDYEQRVVAWKEKEVIEAMMKSIDDGDQDTQEEEDSEEASELLPEDENHIANTCSRINQFIKVSTRKVATVAKESSNPILIELLNDARFRPLPLVNTTRAKEDLIQNRDSLKVAVQQFTAQGPIETSLGDDCMGCTRGWSHYCSVLKRPIPGSEHRAKLQPPVSSWTATRIGLGLKVNLPDEDDHPKQVVLNDSAADSGISKICPNYQPRDGFSLSTPSLRLDDTNAFIESATAIKTLDMDTDDSVPNDNMPGNPSPEKSKTLVRGLLPLRGRKKKSTEDAGLDSFNLESGTSTEEGETKRQYRCSHCGTIQPSPFGCIPCRKSQLVTQMAKRSYCTSNSVTDEFLKNSSSADCINYGEGFVKPTCVMLGRSNLNDTSTSGRKKHRDGGLDKIGFSLTKESWAPNVIMPPNPKRIPAPKPFQLDSDITSDNDGESSEESTASEIIVDDDQSWICGRCSHKNEALRTRCSSCQGWKGGRREKIKSSRPRSCTTKGGDTETSQDRHALALKHKDDANELYRTCLEIAISGILVGMIRRDPMRLFAEPVPPDVREYYEVIKDPIDFSTMRSKIISSEYTSLGSFIGDARRLCINACVFNAADSLYAKTAKNIYDSLEIMHARAKKWISILKNTHASSFIISEDGKDESEVDTFKDVKLMWPGAVELLEDGEWLKQQASSDFVRTKENEIAYYGSLAIQRAAAAAKASLATVPDLEGVKQPVVMRSHVQDELLRKYIDEAASRHVGPIELKDEPDWREYQLLKLLKRVQKRRLEGRMSSESGCARCDGVKIGDETNKAVSLLRSKFKRTVDATKPRVAASRCNESTGLASHNARKNTAEKKIEADTPLESIGRVATESMVRVRGSRVHGWGLFADHPFPKGSVVAEYIGEYVSDAVADLREKRYREQRIQDYQFRLDGSLVIDATLRGGYARYINHSCSPNCVAKIVNGKSPNEHLKRVFIVSQRDIQASEELSYDYQFPLEMNLDLRIPCNCGSKQCRGFMNWDTPEKSNRRTAKIIRSSSGRKR